MATSSNGDIYMLSHYTESGLSRPMVRKFDGQIWQQVGPEFVTELTPHSSYKYFKIFISTNDKVFVTLVNKYGSSETLHILKLEDGVWVDACTPLPIISANLFDFFLYDEDFYLTITQGNKFFVKKYNGSGWDIVGGQSGFTIPPL